MLETLKHKSSTTFTDIWSAIKFLRPGKNKNRRVYETDKNKRHTSESSNRCQASGVLSDAIQQTSNTSNLNNDSSPSPEIATQPGLSSNIPATSSSSSSPRPPLPPRYPSSQPQPMLTKATPNNVTVESASLSENNNNLNTDVQVINIITVPDEINNNNQGSTIHDQQNVSEGSNGNILDNTDLESFSNSPTKALESSPSASLSKRRSSFARFLSTTLRLRKHLKTYVYNNTSRKSLLSNSECGSYVSGKSSTALQQSKTEDATSFKASESVFSKTPKASEDTDSRAATFAHFVEEEESNCSSCDCVPNALQVSRDKISTKQETKSLGDNSLDCTSWNHSFSHLNSALDVNNPSEASSSKYEELIQRQPTKEEIAKSSVETSNLSPSSEESVEITPEKKLKFGQLKETHEQKKALGTSQPPRFRVNNTNQPVKVFETEDKTFDLHPVPLDTAPSFLLSPSKPVLSSTVLTKPETIRPITYSKPRYLTTLKPFSPRAQTAGVDNEEPESLPNAPAAVASSVTAESSNAKSSTETLETIENTNIPSTTPDVTTPYSAISSTSSPIPKSKAPPTIEDTVIFSGLKAVPIASIYDNINSSPHPKYEYIITVGKDNNNNTSLTSTSKTLTTAKDLATFSILRTTPLNTTNSKSSSSTTAMETTITVPSPTIHTESVTTPFNVIPLITNQETLTTTKDKDTTIPPLVSKDTPLSDVDDNNVSLATKEVIDGLVSNSALPDACIEEDNHIHEIAKIPNIQDTTKNTDHSAPLKKQSSLKSTTDHNNLKYVIKRSLSNLTAKMLMSRTDSGDKESMKKQEKGQEEEQTKQSEIQQDLLSKKDANHLIEEPQLKETLNEISVSQESELTRNLEHNDDTSKQLQEAAKKDLDAILLYSSVREPTEKEVENFKTTKTIIPDIPKTNDHKEGLHSKKDDDNTHHRHHHKGSQKSAAANLLKLATENLHEKKKDKEARHSAPLAITVSLTIEQQFLMREFASRKHLSLLDFDVHATIGTGTFGRVRAAKLQKSPIRAPLALKILKKSEIIRLKQVEHVKSEKAILKRIRHPFVVHLYATFQDTQHLYMVMEFVRGGDLFSYLRKQGQLNNTEALFYASEILLAFEYLHSGNIVFRDLKPENLLIDGMGHVKLTDFGFAKVVNDRTWTVCGTPEYLAPEVIQNKGHGKSVDWWAFGILIYEMLAGYPPFYDETPFGIYQNILAGKANYPHHFESKVKDLLRKLLTSDKTKRLGCLRGGAEDVKNHRWFKPIDWQECIEKRMQPAFVPPNKPPDDTSLFDHYPDSINEDGMPLLSEEEQQLFEGF